MAIIYGNNLSNNLYGTSVTDYIYAYAGDDYLYGYGGNDYLYGDSDDDYLSGGTGGDRMYGGLGDDTFVVDSISDLVYEYSGQGFDKVYSYITSYTLPTYVENLYLYGSALYGYGNSYSNNIAGNSSANYLYGYGGVDYLFGYSGNDYLDGGTSGDRFYGGWGDDTFVVDSSSDIVYEYTGEGIDKIYSYVSYTLPTYVENLYLFGTAYGGYGNAYNNTIAGNSSANGLYGYGGVDTLYGYSGNDYLSGGDGNDYLDGGVGNDSAYGGLGDDTFVVDSSGDVVYEYSGEGIDKVYAYVSHTMSTYVENLYLYGTALNAYGNAYNNIIVGNSSANSLYGNGGADSIYGYGGNDYLNGGTGNDYLDGGTGGDSFYGGLGDDTFVVDSSSDVVYEYTGEGIDKVYAYASYTLSTYVENLYLYGTASSGYGNAYNNTIAGNSSANYLYGYGGVDNLYGYSGNDYLSGGTGGDRLYGGLGNDTFVVDSSTDLVYEYTGEGTDSVYAYVSYVLPTYVENLYLYGTASSGYGNAYNNVIGGNSSANTIYGYGGNDTLYGYGGSDTLVGGDGSDVLQGSSGSSFEYDVLTGGAGADYFVIGNAGGNFYQATGHASITDYNSVDDYIRIKGSASDFYLNKSSNYGGTSALDTLVYTTGGDLLAVVQDNTSIALTSFYFDFV